jgi:hypothetical protein
MAITMRKALQKYLCLCIACFLSAACVASIPSATEARGPAFGKAPSGETEVIEPAGTARPSNAQLADKALNAKVEALLKQMTLEEKIGQTVQYSAGFATGPAASKLSYDQLTERGEVGSLLNVRSAAATDHYQHIAMEKSRLHIPLLNPL